jgi:hypothetical protein
MRACSLIRSFAAWFVLCVLAAYALLLLNGVLFSAWVAGGPPNPCPEGWALRTKAQVIWSLATILAAVGLFRAIRNYPIVGRATWIVLAVSCFLVVYPWAEREIMIDKCLDGGGRWNAGGLQCEQL